MGAAMGNIIGFRRQRRWRKPARRTPTWLLLTVGGIAGVGLGLGLQHYWQQGPEATSSAAVTFTSCGGLSQSNCVIDGDTFRYQGEKIRIADIDTPEIHPPRCDYEAELGFRAKQRLVVLLNEGPFELAPISRDQDQYGRKLRIVRRAGVSLGDTLVAEGLARTWTGRREPWC